MISIVPLETHAPAPDYDANGIDRTLVRSTLALTPAERARSHDALLADVLLLASAGARARDDRRP